MRKLIEYIILGIVQGLTEPLPVSSSGHMLIFKSLFKMSVLKDLNIEIIANFGSFIAICFIYRKKIWNIIKDFFMYIKTKDKKYYTNFKYALLIVLGTIPAGIAGLFFKDAFASISSNIKYVGIALLITAFFLFLVKNIDGNKDDQDITWKDALIIGLVQILALLPGISRSGSTLTAGLLLGIKKDKAFDFSFMLYLPISIATMILGVSDLVSTNKELLFPYFVSMLMAFIFTYLSLNFFKNMVINKKLKYFVYYCIIVGILVILFL